MGTGLGGTCLRLEDNLKLEGTCFVWTRGKVRGYGQLRVAGTRVMAHRHAYEQVHGPIPTGLVIDHLCHNRACCNVEHLQATTNKRNLENLGSLSRGNTSGHRNVHWYKRRSQWSVCLTDGGKGVFGGYYPEYEIHVAAFYARELRNRHFTNNTLDRLDTLAKIQ